MNFWKTSFYFFYLLFCYGTIGNIMEVGTNETLPMSYFENLKEKQDLNLLQEEEYILLHENISTGVISKCNCQNDTNLLENNKCIENASDIAVLVSNGQVSVVDSHKYNKILYKKGQNCSPEEKKMFVEASEFYLLPSGELIHVSSGFIFSQESYCINHILDNLGKVTWEANVCMKPPKINLCCFHNETYDSTSNSCVPRIKENNDSLILPILMDNEKINWRINDYSFKNITCNDIENKKHINLKEPNVLIYEKDFRFNYKEASRHHPKFYHSSKYCITKNEEGEDNKFSTYSVIFCEPDKNMEHQKKCSDKHCYRKCCPENEIFDIATKSCIPIAKELVYYPEFYQIDSNESFSKLDKEANKIALISGYPLCELFYPMDPSDQFNLLKDGKLHVVGEAEVTIFNAKQYCIDNFLVEEDIKTMPLVCFLERTSCHQIAWRLLLVKVLLIISIFFLVVTLIVYVAVKELRCKLHGRILMFYIVSLLIGYTTIVIQHFTVSIIQMSVCKAMGKFNYFI